MSLADRLESVRRVQQPVAEQLDNNNSPKRARIVDPFLDRDWKNRRRRRHKHIDG